MKETTTTKSNQMNIFIVLRDVWHNAMFILMAAIIGFSAVTIYGRYVRVPEYTSSSTLVVAAKSTTYANAYAALSTASSMAGVLKEVFESDILMQKVEESEGNLPAGISVSANVISGTNLLVLEVTANDPKTAYVVSNSILKNYNGISDYLFSNAVLETVSEPQIPTVESNSFNMKMYRLIAAIAMAALYVIAVVTSCITRKTFKTVYSAQEELDGDCFGVISHEKKLQTFRSFIRKPRKSVLINSPTCSFSFEESNRKFAENLRFKMDQNGYKRVLVTSVAENEGKSTVSTNLAIALSSMGKRVLLVDVDFRKPALYKITEREKKSIPDLVSYIDGQSDFDDIIRKFSRTGVDMIMNFGSKKESTVYIHSVRLQELLDYADKKYDYIVLDSSPIIVGTDVQLVSDIVDCSLIVVRHDYVRLSDINTAIEDIKEGNAKYLGYVLNDYREFNMHVTGDSIYGYSHYENYEYGKTAENNYIEERK